MSFFKKKSFESVKEIENPSRFSKVFGAFVVCLLLFTNNAVALNNKKQLISLELLESSNIKIEKLLQEKDTEQFVLDLPNGIVVNEGGIITSDGYILENTKTSLGDQHGLMREKRNINEENYLYFKGKLAVIASPGSENWYHWLLQILPRLIILKHSKFEYDRIYINNLKFSWQNNSLEEVLKFLKIPQDKLLVINGDSIIQASNLIVPSVPFIPLKGNKLPGWLQKN